MHRYFLDLPLKVKQQSTPNPNTAPTIRHPSIPAHKEQTFPHCTGLPIFGTKQRRFGAPLLSQQRQKRNLVKY